MSEVSKEIIEKINFPHDIKTFIPHQANQL